MHHYYSIQCISKYGKKYFKVAYSNIYQQKTQKLAHFTIIRDTQMLRIFPSLNCNDFGSNKGIVIKLTVMF